MDPEEGWRTDRLAVEALSGAHADEMHGVLADPALHAYVGGAPLSPAELAARYARLAGRRSADGTETWLNWVLRDATTGAAVGELQATLPAGGPGTGPAAIAWVVGTAHQGRGYAREAALSLVERLLAEGWTVVADIHPEHRASQAVARAAGLTPTDEVVDGEVHWSVRPGG